MPTAASGSRARRLDPPGQLRLKIYRRGGLIPLSEAVPVLENFGFRVLEEIPTALERRALGYIHEFRVEIAGEADLEPIFDRAAEIEARDRRRPRAARPRMTSSTSWCSTPGSTPSRWCWLRAWFRYLRQTGVSASAW